MDITPEDETQEILNDKQLMKELNQSRKDVKDGKTISWDKIKHRYGSQEELAIFPPGVEVKTGIPRKSK